MEKDVKTGQDWKPVRFVKMTRLNHLLHQGESITADQRAMIKAVTDNTQRSKVISFSNFN